MDPVPGSRQSGRLLLFKAGWEKQQPPGSPGYVCQGSSLTLVALWLQPCRLEGWVWGCSGLNISRTALHFLSNP